MSPCPSSELLGRLMNSATTQGEEARLELHLDQCAACRDRLESLVADQPVFIRLSGRLRSGRCHSESQNRLQHVVDAFVDEVARMRPVFKPVNVARPTSRDASQTVDRSSHGIAARVGWSLRWAAIFGTTLMLCCFGWMAVSSQMLSQLLRRSEGSSEVAQVPDPTEFIDTASWLTDLSSRGSSSSSFSSSSSSSSVPASATVSTTISAAVVVQEDGVAPAGFDSLTEALEFGANRFGTGSSSRSLIVTCRIGASATTRRLFVPAGCQLTLMRTVSETSEPATPAARPLLVLLPDSFDGFAASRICGRLVLSGISIQGSSGSGAAGRATERAEPVDLFDVQGGEVVFDDCRLSSDTGAILRIRSKGSAILKNCDVHAGYRAVFAVAGDSPRFDLDHCLVTGRSIFEVAYGASRTALPIDINRSRFLGRELLSLVPAPTAWVVAQAAMNPAVKVTLKDSVLASPVVAVAESPSPGGHSSQAVTAVASVTAATELSRLMNLTDEGTRYLIPQRSQDGLLGIKALELSAVFPEARISAGRSIAYMPPVSNFREHLFTNPHEATVADFDWLTLPR